MKFNELEQRSINELVVGMNPSTVRYGNREPEVYVGNSSPSKIESNEKPNSHTAQRDVVNQWCAENLTVMVDETIEIEKYIDERHERIKEIISDGLNYNIIAQMGLGKTYGIIRGLISYCKSANVMAVFLTPLRINVLQIITETAFNEHLLAVYGDLRNHEIVNTIGERKIIIATYDSLKRIEVVLGLTKENTILVLDEYHNFLTQNNYRGEVLRYAFEATKKYKKIIRITGTPETILPKGDSKTIRFKLKSDKSMNKSKYCIVTFEQEGIEQLSKHIISEKENGIIVVLINNIEQHKALKNILLQSGKFHETEIVSLSSDQRKGRFYDYLITNKKFNNSARVVITTSIISDGVNIINDNIGAVYSFEIYNFFLIRQFLARFRNGIKCHYDFIINLRDDSYELVNLDMTIALRINQAEKLTETFNSFTGITDLKKELYIAPTIPEVYYYDQTDGCFRVDSIMIGYNVLTHEMNKMARDVLYRECCLHYMEQYDINISEIHDDNPLSPEAAKPIVIRMIIEMDRSFREFEKKLRSVDLRVLKSFLIQLIIANSDQLRNIKTHNNYDQLKKLEMVTQINHGRELIQMYSNRQVINPVQEYNDYRLKNEIKQHEFTSLIKDIYVTHRTTRKTTNKKNLQRNDNLLIVRKHTHESIKERLYRLWS